MTISVGNSVLLRYNDSEIIKVVITSCEKEQKKLEETGAWYVSEESPVGKNLKGRKQGDIFEIQVEGEKSKYEILGVEKNYFQNTSVAHTWVIFSQGKIVFKGSQEEAAIVFNQLEKIIPGMELKYIQQGVFPEDDFLKGLIFRTINEEEEEEKNRIYNIGRNTYRPRTLNALRRDHKKPHNPRKNVVKNLLTKSDSKNFSEACAEWAYEGDVLLAVVYEINNFSPIFHCSKIYNQQ